MPVTVPVAHDFICPWCYVALIQKERLEAEFDVKIEWKAYELFPEEMEWPDGAPATPPPANKPPVPSRFEFLCLADGLTMPTTQRPSKMRSFNAHQAVEHAYSLGVGDDLVAELYRALWERGEEINDIDVLKRLATGIVPNVDAMETAIRGRHHHDKVVLYDDDAYAAGVYNVPTFFIGGDRYAEQPYSVLRAAIAKVASPLA